MTSHGIISIILYFKNMGIDRSNQIVLFLLVSHMVDIVIVYTMADIVVLYTKSA